MNPTIGAVVISRNDGYGGATDEKLLYCLTALLNAVDEVIYVDWNSPGDVSIIELIRERLPKTGKLRHIQVTEVMHTQLVGHLPGVQKCVEVLARNIGIRRLSTDFIISANGDVMCLDRASIMSGIENDHTFYCVARRECQFPLVAELGPQYAQDMLRENIESFGQHGDGSPLGTTDQWSLINCPGDFQIAHQDVWRDIKGFEESMVFRGYSDSNVQRKAKFYRFGLKLVRSIPVFHFEHYPDTGSCGGAFGDWNNREAALEQFTGTTNGENWGMIDVELKEERL